VREYKNLQEMFDAAPVIQAFMVAISKEPQLQSEKLLEGESFFQYAFGGNVYVVETLEDLKEIHTLEPSPDETRWLSILEAASSFDQAVYLPGERWVMMWMATNNNGGPSFFIPRELADQVTNIKKSMCLSSQDGEPETIRIEGYDADSTVFNT